MTLPLCCVQLWAPHCKTHRAILERLPAQFPLGSDRWSQPPPVPAGRSCAGVEQRWEEAESAVGLGLAGR